MRSTLESLGDDLKNDLKKEVDKEEQKFRAMMITVLKDIVLATPVDTGRARGNWNMSEGTPILEDSTNTDKIGSKTIAAGTDVIGESKNKKDKTLFLTNNLPYIIRLNEGHSKQAPLNFIDNAFNSGVKRFGFS